jgi:pentatricopeptide repeat protein
MITNGFHQEFFLQTKLVGMYAVFSSMENARRLFDRIEKPDVLVWNEMIKGYACNGLCEEALTLYYQMQRADVLPNNFTFPFVLKACASLLALQEGKEIHQHVVRSRFESCVFVQNALVAMYAKCGNLEVARQLFDKMPERDVVSWNAMIAGYAQNGFPNEALRLFDEMQRNCVKPNLITFKSMLPACAQLAALQQGKWIHECIIRSRLKSDVIVETALVDMYAKCGRLGTARELFDKMPKRNVFSWSAMIAGYAQGGRADEALVLFHQMRLANVMLDSVAMLSVIPACAHLAALQQVQNRAE